MTLTTDPATALAAWERQPDAAILTDGWQYAVTMDDIAGWYQTSPEELDAALARHGELTMLYVDICGDLYPVESAEDIHEAQEALRACGLTHTPVYSGGPEEPDSVLTDQILFA